MNIFWVRILIRNKKPPLPQCRTHSISYWSLFSNQVGLSDLTDCRTSSKNTIKRRESCPPQQFCTPFPQTQLSNNSITTKSSSATTESWSCSDQAHSIRGEHYLDSQPGQKAGSLTRDFSQHLRAGSSWPEFFTLLAGVKAPGREPSSAFDWLKQWSNWLHHPKAAKTESNSLERSFEQPHDKIPWSHRPNICNNSRVFMLPFIEQKQVVHKLQNKVEQSSCSNTPTKHSVTVLT